jgi:hypothetical protein
VISLMPKVEKARMHNVLVRRCDGQDAMYEITVQPPIIAIPEQQRRNIIVIQLDSAFVDISRNQCGIPVTKSAMLCGYRATKFRHLIRLGFLSDNLCSKCV